MLQMEPDVTDDQDMFVKVYLSLCVLLFLVNNKPLVYIITPCCAVPCRAVLCRAIHLSLRERHVHCTYSVD